MSRTRHPLLLVLPILVFAAFFAACGDDNDGDATTPASTPTAVPLSGGITVFAASSLTNAFNEIGGAFHDANPGASVTFNFAGSQDLRTQLEQGARADIFASADTKQMDNAVASGVASAESSVFAHNRLVVIVPKANPAGIQTLQDLANPNIKLVLANAGVPAGKYSRQSLDTASADPAFGAAYKDNVLTNLVSEEANVKQVAAKVQLGEADAGIVYSSDVTPELSKDVTKIDIPDTHNVVATYTIALTAEPSNEAVARAFIDFVRSDDGQAILVSHGFLVAGS